MGKDFHNHTILLYLLIVFVISGVNGGGLLGHYYDLNPNLASTFVSPNILLKEPTLSKKNISFVPFNYTILEYSEVVSNWPYDITDDIPTFFMIRWSGNITVPRSGNINSSTLNFTIGSDDGIILVIDNDSLWADWRTKGYSDYNVVKTLKTDTVYGFQLYFFQVMGTAQVAMNISTKDSISYQFTNVNIDVWRVDPRDWAQELLFWRIDPVVNYTMSDWYLYISWTGQLVPKHKFGTEEYRIIVNYKYGFRLTVDGKVSSKLEDYTNPSFLNYFKNCTAMTFYLTAGEKYDIQLDTYHGNLIGGLILYWEYDNISEIIPPTSLIPACGPSPALEGVHCVDGTWYSIVNALTINETYIVFNGNVKMSEFHLVNSTVSVIGDATFEHISIISSMLKVNGCISISKTVDIIWNPQSELNNETNTVLKAECLNGNFEVHVKSDAKCNVNVERTYNQLDITFIPSTSCEEEEKVGGNSFSLFGWPVFLSALFIAICCAIFLVLVILIIVYRCSKASKRILPYKGRPYHKKVEGI